MRGGGQPHLRGGRGFPGSSVPAASQHSRRASAEKESANLGASAPLHGARQGSGKAGHRERVQGSAEPSPPGRGIKGVPWAGRYLAALEEHLPVQFPPGAAAEPPAGGGEQSTWCLDSSRPWGEASPECASGRKVHSVQPRGSLSSVVGAAALCRVSVLLTWDRAERAFAEPGGETDSCPESSDPAAPWALESVGGGEEFPTKLNLLPKLSPVAERG